MLFGRKKRGHTCMRCGNGKKIDGDELICSSCIDEINLRSAPGVKAEDSDGEKLETEYQLTIERRHG